MSRNALKKGKKLSDVAKEQKRDESYKNFITLKRHRVPLRWISWHLSNKM
jgi:hypothetical protein